MNLSRFGSVRAQSSTATVPMTLTSMIRPGLSRFGLALGLRRRAARQRRDGGAVDDVGDRMAGQRPAPGAPAGSRPRPPPSAASRPGRSNAGPPRPAAAASSTTRRAAGSASSQWRASTLMTKPVAPVTSNVTGTP